MVYVAYDSSSSLLANELTSLLLRRDVEELVPHVTAFRDASASENAFVRRLGYAGLISSDRSDLVVSIESVNGSNVDWLNALAVVPSVDMRNQLSSAIANTLDDELIPKL